MKFGYLVLEIRRAVRNRRFLIFSVGFPAVLFLLYVSIFTQGDEVGIGVLMVNMTAFGALSASLFAGARVAMERSVGWQRQLRLTPLPGASYLVAKGITGMLLAVPAVLVVPLLGGFVEGVSLDAAGWLRVTLGTWLAIIPFALFGLLIGQTGAPDTVQQVSSITMLVMSLVGGIFIPMPGWLAQIAHLLPSYWLGQVGRGAVTSELSVNLGEAVLVLAGWTLVLGFAVIRRYRRDSARV